MRPLEGRVALVAGATRGAGRGIAVALGEAGATVWCTGRSTRGAPATPGRAETIEETAELVARAGGRGIAARVDHRREEEVRALVDRIRRESGRLDVLVNDVWGGDALTEWGKPFWELDLAKVLAMLETALHSHLVTARLAVPLMVEAGRGLVVEVTDGDSFAYRGNLAYDLVKTSVIRLAFAMHEDLRSRGVVALAVTPGFLRSEAVLDHFGVGAASWREAIAQDPNFAHSETPLFVGRGVAALAADAGVAAKGGRVHASWNLAEEYGFVDADGARPHWRRHFDATYGRIFPPADEGLYEYFGDWRAARKALGM